MPFVESSRSPDASRGFLLAGCVKFVNSTANQRSSQARARRNAEALAGLAEQRPMGVRMLHAMILTIVLLMLSATIAMRRIEEDIIRRYPPDKRRPDNLS